MKINIQHIILLLLVFLLSCNEAKESTNCLRVELPQNGDTIVINNTINGVKIENFNFIHATEKYLQGITEDQMDLKLWAEIYTELDSSKRKVDAFVLKTNKSKQNYIDFVSWIQDENPINTNDRSKPYIIHPVTGELNRIKDGIVIRNSVDDSHADKLLKNASEIEEWNEYGWDENSIVNFRINYFNEELMTYNGNCKESIPKSIFKTLINFGIKKNISNEN